jgi:DNA-binding MarR family transcriptional regulator
MSENEFLSLSYEIQVYTALLLKFFNTSLEERLRARGLAISALQHSILRMLEYETLTISDISKRLGLEPSTVLRSLDALERKGLARRGRDARDRRRNPLYITPAGLQFLKDVPVIAPDDPALNALQQMGRESGEHLRDLLRAFILQSSDGKLVVSQMEALKQQTQDNTGDSE